MITVEQGYQIILENESNLFREADPKIRTVSYAEEKATWEAVYYIFKVYFNRKDSWFRIAINKETGWCSNIYGGLPDFLKDIYIRSDKKVTSVEEAIGIAYRYTEVIFDDEEPETVSYKFAGELTKSIGDMYIFRTLVNGKDILCPIAVHKETGKCFPAVF